MKHPTARLVTISLLTLAASVASAQVPALLPVQGQLSDDAGLPVEGDVNLSFALYDVATGGTAFFEASRSLTLEGGVFSVYLGREQSIDFRAMPATGEVYIGLKVGDGPELSPRIQVGTAPFAARAAQCGEASSLEGASASDFATVDHAHAYSSLSGIPTEFTPSAHGHSWSELTGVPATFPAAAHAHAWSELTGVPASLADGDDDSFAALSCNGGQVPVFSGPMGWTCTTIDPAADVQSADLFLRNTGDTVAGDLQIDGSGWNGNVSAVTINSGAQSMRIDGNDIETTGGALLLNRRGGEDVKVYGDLLPQADLIVEPTVRQNSGTTPLEQTLGKYVVQNNGPTDGRSWGLPIADSVIETYCGDLDGCTVVLIERGHNPRILARRQSTPPRTFMTDSATRLWSLNDSASGQWGGTNPTRVEVLSMGRCAFAINQNLASGAILNFALAKEVADSGGTDRSCTLVITD